MKTRTLAFLLLLAFGTAKANQIDSSQTVVDSIDLKINYLFYTASSPAENKQPELNAQTVQQMAQSKTWFGKVFQAIADAFDFLLNNSGHYSEDGMKLEGPYFMFNRNYGPSVYDQIQSVRSNIISGNHSYLQIYQDIFDKAGTTEIYNCNISNWDYITGPPSGAVCGSATRAKASAFIYLVGLTSDGQDTLSYAARKEYRDRALRFLKRVDPPYLQDYQDVVGSLLPIFNHLTFAIAGFSDRNGMQFRSKELLMIVETIDMLRWVKQIDPYTADLQTVDKEDMDEICEHIIKHYVVPMHRRCQNYHYFSHNNLALMPAAALGAAAIEFRKYGSSIISFNKWPKRWANSANFNIHNTMWWDGNAFNSRMAKSGAEGEGYGYAEGPHYFRYAFESLLPYFKARANFSGLDKVVSYHSFLLDPVPARVRNFTYDRDYDNLYKWYNNLIQTDGSAAAIEDTYHNSQFNGVLALRGKPFGSGTPTYNFVTDWTRMGLSGATAMSLREDYLCALQPPEQYPLSSIHMKGGYSIIRSGSAQTDKHFLLALSNTDDNYHTHADAGSFVITADDQILMMDPPYFDYGNRDYVKDLKHHSTMGMDQSHFYAVPESNPIEGFTDNPLEASFKIKLRYGITDANTSVWTRTFKVFKDDPVFGYYYLITDYVENDDNGEKRFLLNGNGNWVDPEISFADSSGIYWWYWPCVQNKKWRIKAAITASVPASEFTVGHQTDAYHGNLDGSLTKRTNPVGSEGSLNGQHNKLVAKINTEASSFSVQTYLYPTKCSDNSGQKIAQRTTPDYGLITVNGGLNDQEFRVHVSKHDHTTDTIHEPMGFDLGAVLSTNAFSAYLGYNQDSVFRSKYCVSYAKIRRLGISNGNRLEYAGTELINSDSLVSITSILTGKFKYTGVATITSNGTKIKIYMPDLEQNYLMVARDSKTGGLIPSDHASTSPTDYKYIEVTFPEGTTEFVLELADPCLVSCFFPPTGTTIDTLFDFAEGSTEPLGHDLDIVQDKGWLNITAGSKMSICPTHYLFNRDSITLNSFERIDQTYPYYSAFGDLPSGGSGTTDPEYNKRFGSKRSMIIVNDKAALILDSGSYTHVGVGSTILIRRGGTFYIKSGATLEIGSNSMNDQGEVIVEAGAYVCIEDSSDLHFFITEKDTNDKNIFFVPVDQGVNERVNLAAINGEFVSGGRFGNDRDCLPLCSLWYYLPPHGVNNPEFGTNSVGKPYAFFTNLPDTVCDIDTLVVINAKRSRNEAKYTITVTRDNLIGPAYVRSEAYGYQSLTDNEIVNISALGTGTGTLRFKLKVQNVCGDSDIYVKTVFIADTPSAYFTLNKDSICPGMGSLMANGSSSVNGTGDSIRHIWSVSLLDPFQYAANDANHLNYTKSWEYTSLNVDDSFNFPGFKWLGGFRYVVGLTVFGRCEYEAQYWDTVTVPLEAWINPQGLKSTHTNLGTFGVELQGVITSPYDSFAWYPKPSLLNTNTLTVNTNSSDTSLMVVLTAYKDECKVSDTITVKHRNFINLGADETVCAGTVKVVGNKLEASLIVGLMGLLDDIGPDHTHYNSLASTLEGSCGQLSSRLSELLYYNDYSYYDGLGMNPAPFLAFIKNWGHMFYNHPDYYTMVYPNYLTMTPSTYMSWFASSFTNATVNNGLYNLFKTDIDMYNSMGIILDLYQAQIEGHLDGLLNAAATHCSDMNIITQWYINDTYHASYDNNFVMRQTIDETTKYGFMVNTGSVVEYDEVTYTVEDTISPEFGIGGFADSTVSFLNYTSRMNPASVTYLWNFGDGTTSSAMSPTHTFPAFNASYRVCLTASNLCNSFQFCDTVHVDSSSLSSLSFGKRGDDDQTNASLFKAESENQKVIKLSNQNILGSNRPNPFNGTTLIDYELVPSYRSAQLVITNTLGQTVHKTDLPIVKGTLQINRAALSDGMYYYSLVVDGITTETKIMVVK